MCGIMKSLDSHVGLALNRYSEELEKRPELNCDVAAYVGQIHPVFVQSFIEFIERIAASPNSSGANKGRLALVLITPGGVAEAVEKMVEIIRHHYSEVFFIVPSAAMSAGTIFCMSGDKIFMDYSSSLGPIDPQVPSQDGRLVPALGYIDKVNEIIGKAENRGGLNDAELILLKGLDLAMLSRYEQARELSISLLKMWLVKYKFKDWLSHRTNNPGSTVTDAEKQSRAEEIARLLSDNKIWHSHGRMIGIETLRSVLKLDIEDYTNLKELRDLIRTYSELLTEYLERQDAPVFMHSNRA